MPHRARKKSASGYYHVVPKGLGDQLIFEDDLNRALYLELLKKAKEQTGLIVHAYCLMSNHTHLIVEDRSDTLADAMKFLHERYAMKYAEQTGRTGGVFRKPFWSEPIETDNHLLCAVRYTHANPATAGICPAFAYDWSSAKDYLGRDGVADTEMVLSMLGGKSGFIEWSRASNATASAFPGSRLRGHLTDDEAARIARDILGFDGSVLASMTRRERAEPVSLLLGRGIPIRQLSRVTGLGRGSIELALQDATAA